MPTPIQAPSSASAGASMDTSSLFTPEMFDMDPFSTPYSVELSTCYIFVCFQRATCD